MEYIRTRSVQVDFNLQMLHFTAQHHFGSVRLPMLFTLSPTPAPRVSLRFFYRFIPSHIHLRMMISLRGFLFLFSFACSAYAPFGVQTNYGIIVSQSETLEDIKASKHMFLRCVFSLFILARRCNCISPLERSRNDSQLCRVSPYQIRHCIRRCEAIETKFTIFYLLPLV